MSFDGRKVTEQGDDWELEFPSHGQCRVQQKDQCSHTRPRTCRRTWKKLLSLVPSHGSSVRLSAIDIPFESECSHNVHDCHQRKGKFAEASSGRLTPERSAYFRPLDQWTVGRRYTVVDKLLQPFACEFRD